MGAHPVPYDFTPFLEDIAGAPYDDAVMWAWLDRHEIADETKLWLMGLARECATNLRELADFVERTENLPRLAGKGPYDNDPQQVVLPAETWESLAAVHGSGIWSKTLPDAVRYAASYLVNQNGEAGVACSLACTDGLLRVLEALPGDRRSAAVVQAIREAGPNEWVHGAQFVTEIQGGSDAAQNAVTARRSPEADDEAWSLWGQKWFCSNLTADYWLVAARPEAAPPGGKGVALFCVPRDQDGYTVERLKDKLGTRALPTAEILFRGAKGWPVGPLDAGIRNVLRHVLVPSRIHNILAAAAFLRRAAREARAYAAFREAFAMPLERMPLIADTLERLETVAARAEAGAFATVDAWLEAERTGADPEHLAWARFLVSIHKAVATRRLSGLLHEAMSVLGGNGIEERFTALPRLYRDAIILETWEGPYTLLLMQALSDLERFEVKGREAEFLGPRLGDDAIPRRLAGLLAQNDRNDAIRLWPPLATAIVEAWEEKAYHDLMA